MTATQIPAGDQSSTRETGVDRQTVKFVEEAEVERGVVLTGSGSTRAEALADLHEQLADEFPS